MLEVRFRNQKGTRFHHHWSVQELSSGLKDTSSAKFNTVLFLVLRMVSVLVIFGLSGNNEPQNLEMDSTSLIFYFSE